jgi:hypothetical protein
VRRRVAPFPIRVIVSVVSRPGCVVYLPAKLRLHALQLHRLPWNETIYGSRRSSRLMLSPPHPLCPFTCRRPRTPYASPYSEGAVAPQEKANTIHVSAETAAAWDNDHARPDYSRQWPKCIGKCIDRACALAWEAPRCCYVASKHRREYRRQHDGPGYGRRTERYSAHADRKEDDKGYDLFGRPFDSPPEIDQSTDAELMGYWLDKDFYCRK